MAGVAHDRDSFDRRSNIPFLNAKNLSTSAEVSQINGGLAGVAYDRDSFERGTNIPFLNKWRSGWGRTQPGLVRPQVEYTFPKYKKPQHVC
ncbi:hypothetical protein GCM10007932_40620 [Vibrio penaeicida]|uniref:TonB-dependent receptor n=1 Tax=Vibrio penaeicida TaxID=104609 RepID=A0AAV5NXH6_9VIBR|nr:hypothetical protein GCM10007932_40620 [Vibrio penaeicida]